MPSPGATGDSARTRNDQEAKEQAIEPASSEPSIQNRQERDESLGTARQDVASQHAVQAEIAWLETDRQEAARQLAALEAMARREAARLEAARAETTRLEAERQETARQAAALEDMARQEASRQEAARAETARLEAERQETARQAAALEDLAQREAARQEAARAETARMEAERQETARQAAAVEDLARREAARQEAARAETARLDAARTEAARTEAARVEVAQEAAARREATLRAIGRQLDEEAARREAATAASRQLPSSSGVRRYRLFGRADPNAEIIRYAEAWSRKIQLNMTFEMVREAAKQPHADPVVTVAVRSDGSVESVTFDRSSGVAALDDAIRRVVQSQTPYQVFPPGLARDFDVLEIRRTWYFDVAIRLY